MEGHTTFEKYLFVSFAHLQKHTDRGIASTKRMAKRLRPTLVRMEEDGFIDGCCNLCISNDRGAIVLGGHKFSIIIDCETRTGHRVAHGESCKLR